ncbi:hypothetical protein [Rhizobium leguminosarum]
MSLTLHRFIDDLYRQHERARIRMPGEELVIAGVDGDYLASGSLKDQFVALLDDPNLHLAGAL